MNELTQEMKAFLATELPTPDQVARLLPAAVARLTPAAFARLSPDQVARLTPAAFAWLSPDQVARLTPAAFARLTPDQVAWLSPDQVARLTPAAVARLSPAAVARLQKLLAQVPRVENLYSGILADIRAGQRQLDQSDLGPEGDPGGNLCDTPMCIAGHTVHRAGAAGYELKNTYGFATAAAMIHAVSCPGVPHPRYDNYPNDWALAYIEARAAEESR